jgi:neutral trehalase
MYGSLPDVKLNLEKDWYNVLMTALNSNKKIADLSDEAENLIYRIEKYTRINNGYAELRFYRSHAEDAIWQLLVAVGINSEMPKHDYFGELQKQREEAALASGDASETTVPESGTDTK